MSKPSQRAKRPLSYPDETTGSKLAAEMRKKTNSLTPEQENYCFQKAMALIYAGDGAKEAASVRR
jgi:hypothetical protein